MNLSDESFGELKKFSSIICCNYNRVTFFNDLHKINYTSFKPLPTKTK